MSTPKLNEDNFTKSKQSVAIEGWVGRSKYGLLVFFTVQPKRICGDWWSQKGYFKAHLPTDFFPDLKWSDEPLPVKITIDEI